MRPLTIEHVEQRLRAALDAEDWLVVDGLISMLDVLDQQQQQRREAVTCASAALYYAHVGLHVFPLQPQSKLPYPRSRGCKDATSDAERISRWWDAAPSANVAIATGHVVDVIDIDGSAGVLSYARVDDLPDVIGKVSTPRAGGLHLYVRADGTYGNRARVADGIDYRGRGGYVVAPPSVNADGAHYRWITALELKEKT